MISQESTGMLKKKAEYVLLVLGAGVGGGDRVLSSRYNAQSVPTVFSLVPGAYISLPGMTLLSLAVTRPVDVLSSGLVCESLPRREEKEFFRASFVFEHVPLVRSPNFILRIPRVLNKVLLSFLAFPFHSYDTPRYFLSRRKRELIRRELIRRELIRTR